MSLVVRNAMKRHRERKAAEKERLVLFSGQPKKSAERKTGGWHRRSAVHVTREDLDAHHEAILRFCEKYERLRTVT